MPFLTAFFLHKIRRPTHSFFPKAATATSMRVLLVIRLWYTFEVSEVRISDGYAACFTYRERQANLPDRFKSFQGLLVDFSSTCGGPCFKMYGFFFCSRSVLFIPESRRSARCPVVKIGSTLKCVRPSHLLQRGCQFLFGPPFWRRSTSLFVPFLMISWVGVSVGCYNSCFSVGQSQHPLPPLSSPFPTHNPTSPPPPMRAAQTPVLLGLFRRGGCTPPSDYAISIIFVVTARFPVWNLSEGCQQNRMQWLN